MARHHLASRLALGVTTVVALGALSRAAHAGGYDTPILYSARHMGMGGTAIGYVSDPSALFHNPAGLGGVRGLEFIGDISPLTGSITSSPGYPDTEDKATHTYRARTTEPAVSPLFLAGAAYRLAEPVTFGIGVYPVAAAAGEYRTPDVQGVVNIDKTRLVFLEISPGLSVELVKGLYVGAGYRATIATLERVKGNAADPREFNFELKGVDAAGVRVGMQYHASQNFSVGLVYRHKVAPTLKADKVFAYTNLVDGETVFVLPSKLGVGVSGKMDRLHGALDVEYGFYSQNKSSNLSGYNPVLREQLTVPNVFEWQNAITTRIGLEYLLGAENQFPVRIGYVFDGKVGNKMYPTAFGTPPAPSHSLTAGAGFRGEKWQTNLAVAYRFASASVTPADVAGASACASCSKAGPDYNLKILGFYLDFSYRFDVAPLFGGAPAAAPGVPETPAVPSPSPGPLPTPAPSPDPAPPALPSSPPTPAPAPSP